VVAITPRERPKANNKNRWLQFFPYCPLRLVNELRGLEAHYPLKRNWNVVGAMSVYGRTITTFWLAGRTIVEDHRFRHRAHVGKACDITCVARELHAFVGLAMPKDLNPRLLPFCPIVIPLIERALGYRILKSRSFHREVVRDQQKLREVAAKPKAERSMAEKRLFLRYWVTASALEGRQKISPSRDNLRLSPN
jgi:hypothetical protein